MAGSRKTWSLLVADPSLIFGLISTGIFYSIILQPGLSETQLARFTSEHAVEYVIVTLFFWGMADIIMKVSSLPWAYIAACHEWLPARTGREPASKARELLDHIRQNPAWMLASCTGRRLIHALSLVAEKGTSDDYREQLQHLADMDDQELHAKYTVLRFVISVTPILGFLGTVVHFGSAIGSFSFENMDEKLPEIVAGMGTAFNTTSVALATAMTMMFAMFLCERLDQSVVATTDRLIDRELLHRFETQDANFGPFLSVIQDANRETLDQIARTLHEQVRTWAQSLDVLFGHFQERHQQESARDQAAFEALQQRHEAYEAARVEQFQQLISLVDARQEQSWKQLQTTLERASLFREEIGELTKALNAIAHGEGRLIELQATLSDNLRVLHESSQMDSAMHGLTAAIHLMTTRNRQINLSDASAA